MDEAETRTCSNCKRDIPAVNFTIHTVHCARNIRMCPVCKEPVPVADLQDHHDKMHKLLPCKKCGEQVCGSDLEDHIRDSCALTTQTCKFCELELPRRELPAHEAYCGVRTEQCADCAEWVMLKYRQLHLDSNHGFLRLTDDPPPPKKEVAKVTRLPKPANIPAPTPQPSTSRSAPIARPNTNGTAQPSTSNGPGIIDRQKDEDSGGDEAKSVWRQRSSLENGAKEEAEALWRQRALLENVAKNGKLPKRTNDQPQINTNTTDCGKASLKKMFKKRPAPAPPGPAPSAVRDLPYYSAVRRAQDEERQRQEQTAYNLAHGLPPVLNPAAKLEKLRKMDRLQNPDAYQDHPGPSRAPQQRRNVLISPESPEERWNEEELRNLKPMTPEEFAQRFNALRLAPDSGARGNSSGANGNGNGREPANVYGDRFSEIKSSLRELRRGLNEVTAPYNSNAVMNDLVNEHRSRGSIRRDRRRGGDNVGGATDVGGDGAEVRLPCEFCGELQPLDDLVQHQTGCRPDLAQLRTARAAAATALAAAAAAAAPPPPQPDPYELPVIPCEFCTQSLPVYLINDHQERCRLDASYDNSWVQL